MNRLERRQHEKFMRYVNRMQDRRKKLRYRVLFWRVVSILLALIVILLITYPFANSAVAVDTQVEEPSTALETEPLLTEEQYTEIVADTNWNLVCRVVAAEARGEGHDGMLAVAQVIRDRSILWGMTPAEVITARGQFAAPYEGEVSQEMIGAVESCFLDGESAFDSYVTHFHEKSITPYWVKDMTFVGRIGNHKFYNAK